MVHSDRVGTACTVFVKLAVEPIAEVMLLNVHVTP